MRVSVQTDGAPDVSGSRALYPHYTLVICTCDAYADAWPPLFTLFRKYWPGLDAPIVLNTETRTFEFPGYDILCPQIYKGHPNPASVPWSRRLRETLTQAVTSDLVLIFLDDFYLRSPVNEDRLEICLRLMESDLDIANIALFPCPPPFTPTKEHPWLARRSKSAPYLFNLQAGLWRRQRLLHFLRDHESPWYFERWGSKRGRRYPDDFYGLNVEDERELIFNYWPSMQGLSKGMWLPKTPELFEQEGIDVDLTARGVMPLGWRAPAARRHWLKSGWNIFRSLRP